MASDGPPLPLAAHLGTPPIDVIVIFDRPLATVPILNIANWAVRLAGVAQFVNAAAAAGYCVSLATTPGFPDPGPDVVSYSPPPFDVVGAHTVPVAAFTALPIT